MFQARQQLGAPPIEGAGQDLCSPTGFVTLGVRMAALGSGPAGDILELQVNGGDLQFSTVDHSAGQPFSDSRNPGVVSVGAIDPWNATTVAWYSSRGPTNDGRVKPDLTAASGVSTLAFGSTAFKGTSAASPVAAGAAALVKQKGLTPRPEAIRAYLMAAALDRGPPGPDNAYGGGEVVLPPLPPAAYLASSLHPLTPFRLTDTRRGAAIGPWSVLTVGVLGVGGIPASGVTAVIANVTATQASAPGFVAAYPQAWGVVGATSNLNVEQRGETMANLAVVPVGANGKIAVLTQGGTHLVVDIFGYYSAAPAGATSGRLFAPAPRRVLDTRVGKGLPGSVPAKPRAESITTIDLTSVGTASAVVLNLTATQASGPGYLQVLPGASDSVRGYSNVNIGHANQSIANPCRDPSGRVEARAGVQLERRSTGGGPARCVHRWQRARVLGSLVEPAVDQPPSDRDGGRDERQLGPAEPTSVEDLRLVHGDVTARPRGAEADHERMREGPRLAADVAKPADAHPDLFADLSVHGLLERLAGLNEAREAAVHGDGEVAPRASNASSPRVTSTMMAGARRGKLSNPQAGQRMARSPGVGSVLVAQRPQNRCVRDHSTICTARPATVHSVSLRTPHRERRSR